MDFDDFYAKMFLCYKHFVFKSILKLEPININCSAYGAKCPFYIDFPLIFHNFWGMHCLFHHPVWIFLAPKATVVFVDTPFQVKNCFIWKNHLFKEGGRSIDLVKNRLSKIGASHLIIQFQGLNNMWQVSLVAWILESFSNWCYTTGRLVRHSSQRLFWVSD